MIEALLLKLGVKTEVLIPLSRFLTIEGKLPLGFPTSPVISNAIFLGADKELQALAERTGAVYTRYSDDISMSSKDNFNNYQEIAGIIQSPSDKGLRQG